MPPRDALTLAAGEHALGAGRCKAGAWQVHGRCKVGAWYGWEHGKCMAGAWCDVRRGLGGRGAQGWGRRGAGVRRAGVGRGCRCGAHSQLPSMSVMYAMRVLVAPSSALSRSRFADGLRAFGSGGLGNFGSADAGGSWELFPTGLPSTGEVRAVTPTSGPDNEPLSSLDLIARVTSPGSAKPSIEPAVFFIQPEIPSRPFRAHKGSQAFFLGLLPSLICLIYLRWAGGGGSTPALAR